MRNLLVLQSDFGVSDGAVSAMYGVANTVDPTIRIFDLTHDIPPFNIWEASYRLLQTVSYWPEGTVFVSVVDPGVGSDRRSIVVKTLDHKYIITPDNGTLTHIKAFCGIEEARIIDETVNRLPNSGESYTFHGRDIYAYTGARLASGVISYEEVGPRVGTDTVVVSPLSEAYVSELTTLTGIIEILDVRFGNLWTNINRQLLKELNIQYGDTLEISIENNQQTIYNNTMKFGRSFADSDVGEPLVYVNSLNNLGVAINQESFAKTYDIGTGTDWVIHLRKSL